MGCDIHLHSEVKINGTWHHYAKYDCKRNYALFAKMANVRNNDNDIAPLSLPKGMPKDASFLTQFMCDEYGVDGHSHSWLSAKEIALLEDWMRANCFENPSHNVYIENTYWGYFFGNTWGGFTKYPNERPKGVEDVRFVFWFDN